MVSPQPLALFLQKSQPISFAQALQQLRGNVDHHAVLVPPLLRDNRFLITLRDALLLLLLLLLLEGSGGDVLLVLLLWKLRYLALLQHLLQLRRQLLGWKAAQIHRWSGELRHLGTGRWSVLWYLVLEWMCDGRLVG